MLRPSLTFRSGNVIYVVAVTVLVLSGLDRSHHVAAQCRLCGDAPMLNPDGVLTTRQGQTGTCGLLEQNVVHLPETGTACQNLQALALTPCQCAGWNSTSTTSNATTTEEFVCSICRGGEIGNPNGLVVSTTGQPTRCSVLHANRQSISEAACPRIQAFALAACECTAPPQEQDEEGGETTGDNSMAVDQDVGCPICGVGGVVGNPNGLVTNNRGQTARCATLEANQDSVPPNTCDILQALARDPCECYQALDENTEDLGGVPTSTVAPNASFPDLSEVELCSICGEGVMTIPEGIVTNPQGRAARCDVMQANAAAIPENACEQVQAMSREPCGCSRVVNIDPVNPQQNQTQGTQGSSTNVTTDVGNSGTGDINGTSSSAFVCPICGDGVMNNPDGIVVTRQGQAARCSALNANADTIPESACPNIQSLASLPCDCVEPASLVNGTQPGATNGNGEGGEQGPFICNVCGDNQSIRDPDRRIVTSMGMYTCSNAHTAGLIGAIPEEHCESIRISVSQECGCVADGPTQAPTEEPYMCSICSDGRVATNLEGVIDVLLTSLGTSGLTCGQYEIAASRGRVQEDECAAIQAVSESPCGCKVPEPDPTPAPTGFVCPICGAGMEVGFPEGEVTLPNSQRMSCGDLLMRAEMNIIQPTQCTQIQPFVREACACVEAVQPDPTFAPTAFECNICGDGRLATNLDGVVVIPTQPDRTCADLMVAASIGNINPSQCTLLHPFTQSPCRCINDDSTVPSDMPSFTPTGPTISPAPTSIMEREDCYASLKEIHEIEREVKDTSAKRKYILCPGRTFHMGVWTEDGRIKDGEPFIALRPNAVYQCGEDGSRQNNCVLRGGDFGLASYYGVFGGLYESVEGVEIRGLTFESQNMFSVLLKAAGDISFIGCAFKVSQVSYRRINAYDLVSTIKIVKCPSLYHQ
jgi:hypothetical protein